MKKEYEIKLSNLAKAVSAMEAAKWKGDLMDKSFIADRCGINDIAQAIIMALGDYEKVSGGCWTHDSYIPYVTLNDKKFYVMKNVGNMFYLDINDLYVERGITVTRCEKYADSVLLYSLDLDVMIAIYKMKHKGSEYNKGLDYRVPWEIKVLKKEKLLCADKNENSSWLGAGFVPSDVHFEKPLIIQFNNDTYSMTVEDKKEGTLHMTDGYRKDGYKMYIED